MSSVELDLAYKVHDLRNKIGAASSFVQLLTNAHPDLEANNYVISIEECLGSAIEASRDISLGIKNPATEEARLDAKSQDFLSVTEVLSILALQAYAVLNRQFPIEIEYSYSLLPQDRSITLNQEEVSSIRENIITNAVAAGATQLKVCYQMKEYGLVMSLQDNGCGMSEDQMCELQLKQAGDGRVHGLGTSKIISAIDEHRAVVTYASREGEGTTVKILCPYVSERVAS